MSTDASHEGSPAPADDTAYLDDTVYLDETAPADERDAEELVLVEEVEAELVLPVWEATGEPRVDAALDLLTTLDPDDLGGHAAVFDAVHQQLREALTDLDSTSA